MYKEVAFDPSCMVSMEYYGLVKQHFGFEHGRYIAADIKSWAREAMVHVKNSPLQPIKKKSIQNYLNNLGRNSKVDEFCLARDRKSVNSDNWNDWFQAQLAIRPFSFAISESTEIDCINVDAINAGNCLWIVEQSLSIDRSAIGLFKALESLIQISNEIMLVDPYFKFANNGNLAELFRISSLANINKVSVVTSMETPGAMKIYTGEYLGLNKAGFRFKWIKVPDISFHDRYFITDVGAVRSGHGFMIGPKKGVHSDMANLNIISKAEADRAKRELEKMIRSRVADIILDV